MYGTVVPSFRGLATCGVGSEQGDPAFLPYPTTTSSPPTMGRVVEMDGLSNHTGERHGIYLTYLRYGMATGCLPAGYTPSHCKR